MVTQHTPDLGFTCGRFLSCNAYEPFVAQVHALHVVMPAALLPFSKWDTSMLFRPGRVDKGNDLAGLPAGSHKLAEIHSSSVHGLRQLWIHQLPVSISAKNKHTHILLKCRKPVANMNHTPTTIAGPPALCGTVRRTPEGQFRTDHILGWELFRFKRHQWLKIQIPRGTQV